MLARLTLLVSLATVPLDAQTRVALPSGLLPGYARTVRGEELVYHSPMPWVDRSLLVRSLDRRMDVVWETAPVPEAFAGDTAVLVFALGIDVTDTTRRFDLFLDGDSVLAFSSPPVAALGTHEWRGRGGVRIAFEATLVDKYGDLMGFAFLHVPRRRVRPGQPLTLRVAGESQGLRTWFMVFTEALVEGAILRNAPALVRSAEGNRQIVRVDLLSLADVARFRMTSPLGGIDTVVAIGHTRFQLPIQAVAGDSAVPIGIALDDRRAEAEFAVTPVRPLEVHLIHHTHLDIGYTEHQDSVERRHWSHLREALRLGRATADRPEGERFIWHPEGTWAVESYLARYPDDSTAIAEGVRAGWISLDAMFANLLTGMASTEGLAHALDAKRRLEQFTGVPIVSAMQSDIPGATWGLVPLFARHGVRYFSIGPNQGHRIGHFTEALGDRPFWWTSADGTDSVLTWVHGAGYSLFHTGLGYTSLRRPLDEESVFRYLEQLAESDYPYDLTVLRYNIGSDNGPPDADLAESVRAWNARYASPRIVISSVPGAFRAFEARYGAVLPSLRGDLTGHWEDGVQSTARETTAVRRTAERLQQTEELAAVWGVTLPPDELAQAWRFVLLYYEHTWGAWNSIGEPEVAPVLAQWARKRSFADSAALLVDRLQARALRGRRPHVPEGGIEVWNSTEAPRSGLVVLPHGASVTTADGAPVPSQRLRDGRLAFVARDVPAAGFRVFRIGPASEDDTTTLPAGDPAAIESDRFRLRVNAQRGTVVSLVDRRTDRELVHQGEDGGLAAYVYVPGRDPATAVTAGPATLHPGERGPLVRSLVWRGQAPGSDGLETEVRLVEGLDEVEIVVRIDKRLVYDPEAVLLRFGFAGRPETVRVSIPGGAFRLEQEQLPGANRNYLNARSWIELAGAGGADRVSVVSLDVPMVQVGSIGSDPIVTGWRTHAEPSGTIWSYVMNNYWETNYRAGQDGLAEFRYLVAPDVEPEVAARTVTRPLVVVD